MSQRIGVSQGQTERTRALELQRSMQSSMRSSKDKNKQKSKIAQAMPGAD